MAYKYSYKSIYNMSIRPGATVNNSPIGSLPANTVAAGDDLLVLSNGDKWLYILEGATVRGWVAVVHLGKVWGTLTEIVAPPPVEPPVTSPVFPDWFDLTDPQGNKQRYNRA